MEQKHRRIHLHMVLFFVCFIFATVSGLCAQPNPRGAGVLFGPDSTRSFLEENGLDMLVRSHECVEEGFDMPFEDEMEGKDEFGEGLGGGGWITFLIRLGGASVNECVCRALW